MMTIEEALQFAEEYSIGTVKRILADEVRRLRDEVNGLTGSLDRAEKALREAQEQEPVAWLCGKDVTTHKEYAEWFMRFTQEDCTQLYARPVPAAPAVAVPAEFFTWVAAYGDYIEKLDVYNKKLTISKALPFPGLDMNDEFQAFSAAQRKAHRMLPDLFEKARALLQSATVEPNVSTLTLNAADSAQSEQEGMILMPVKADEALVAGFVGCETREEAMLGWDVAVWIQEVRTGKRKLVDPVHFNEAEVIRLQKKLDETREELRNTRERLAERLKAIEPPFEVVNPACQACGDGTTSLCDHEDCPSGRFRGYDPMNRLIASDPKMKNPNCPREQIAKCVAGFCVKDVTGNPRCDSADDFIADAMSAPSPEIEEMTIAMAQEICAVSCSIGAYPQVLSAEVTRLQVQVEAARKMTLQIISVHVIADDIPGPSEKARRYYNRLAERFGVDRLEGSHENG